MPTAFDPITFGRYPLANRIVMAPMTRSRAHAGDATATALMAEYYAQRASAGLIITEGTQPSAVGQGYPFTPGLHTDEQVRSWRNVTDAVHDAGGRIFAQLMHTGRIGHPSLYPTPMTPVGASSVAAKGQSFTPAGPQDFVVPRVLTEQEIVATIEDFASAARRAIDAGFDGVELHGANGYLLHQFMSTNTNQREDRWGGSIGNRIRLTVETTRAVADAIGPDRTGLRISPSNTLNDIADETYTDTYPALVDALNPIGLAYLHLMETGDHELTLRLRDQWQGLFILNPATPESFTGLGELHLIDDGETDLLSFGSAFLANPDLPARLAAGGPFNVTDYSTAYGGDHRGYTDYPALVADSAAA